MMACKKGSSLLLTDRIKYIAHLLYFASKYNFVPIVTTYFTLSISVSSYGKPTSRVRTLKTFLSVPSSFSNNHVCII